MKGFGSFSEQSAIQRSRFEHLEGRKQLQQQLPQLFDKECIKVLVWFDKNIFSIETEVTFPLTIGLLQGYVQEQMIEAGFVPTGWAHPVLTIANLAGFRGSKAQSQEVKAILDRVLVTTALWGQGVGDFVEATARKRKMG